MRTTTISGLLILCCVPASVSNEGMQETLDDWKAYVEIESMLQGLNPKVSSEIVGLFYALLPVYFERADFPWVICHIFAESGFRTDVVGDDGRSIGLGQVQVRTARRWAVSRLELFDPEINLRVSFDYLRRMRRRYGCIRKAIVAYNAGRVIRNSLHFRKVKRLRAAFPVAGMAAKGEV